MSAFERTLKWHLVSHLCRSAAAGSPAWVCSRPSHDSDRSYGLSRTLADRCRADQADSGLSWESGEVGRGGGWSGDAYGDGATSGSMIAVDDDELGVVVVVGSLRRVDSRLMNDVLCLNRWYDDDVLQQIDR